MTKRSALPSHAETITTYAELAEHARAFANGHLGTLIVAGPPGVGKSRCFRDALGDGAHWVEGNATPFGIYSDAYQHRDELLVLDDVDGLHGDPRGVRLLKSLCQSEPCKQVSWQSHMTQKDDALVPAEFTTTSRVAILTNCWKTLNENVRAVEDRAHLVRFEPSPAEVHGYAGTWFSDREVFDFIGKHLELMERHSLRVYLRAAEKKAGGLGWRRGVLRAGLTGKALEVALLKADPSHACEEDRVRAFVQAGHGCRATYFNYARKLGYGRGAKDSRDQEAGKSNDTPKPSRPRRRVELIQAVASAG